MKKNKKIGLLITVVVIVAGFFTYRISDKVCVELLVGVNTAASPTGTYICFAGADIYQTLTQEGFFETRITELSDFVNKYFSNTSEIDDNEINTNGFSRDQITKTLSQMRQMWTQVENKKVLFTADHVDQEKLRKYIVSGNYNDQRLLLQLEFSLLGDSIHKLQVVRSRNMFSKLLARWHVLGAHFSDNDFRINYFEKLKILFTLDKVCHEQNFCFYYREFNLINANIKSAPGLSEWNELIEDIRSNNQDKILSKLDLKSQRNLGLDRNQNIDLLSKNSGRGINFFKWMLEVTPVATLVGNELIVVFVTQDTGQLGGEVEYRYGAVTSR